MKGGIIDVKNAYASLEIPGTLSPEDARQQKNARLVGFMNMHQTHASKTSATSLSVPDLWSGPPKSGVAATICHLGNAIGGSVATTDGGITQSTTVKESPVLWANDG